jgi:hypothetical protein
LVLLLLCTATSRERLELAHAQSSVVDAVFIGYSLTEAPRP